MNRHYMIGSGYHSGSKSPIDVAAFSRVWLENNRKYCNPAPKKTVIIGDTPYQNDQLTKEFQCIYLHGNLGHIRDKHEGRKNYEIGGWSGTMLALAMVAYCDELDFIYKEQDCLAFGPWVRQMYKDAGDAKMVFGQGLKVYPNLTATQSLFMIKHEFIPTFVQQYLTLGQESNDNFPENKFTTLEQRNPGLLKRLSFGVDRDRPIPYESNEAWYAQQWKSHEFIKAKEYRLL